MTHFWTRPQQTLVLRNSAVDTDLLNRFTQAETSAGAAGGAMTDHTATISRDLKLIVNLLAAKRVLTAQQETQVGNSALSTVALSLNPGTCDDITPGQLVQLAESADLFAQEGTMVSNTLTAINTLLSQADLDIKASISSCGSDAACVFSDFRAVAVTDETTLQTRLTDVQTFITQIDGYVALANQTPLAGSGGSSPTGTTTQTAPTGTTTQTAPTGTTTQTAQTNPPTAGSKPTTGPAKSPHAFGAYEPPRAATEASDANPASESAAGHDEEALAAGTKGGRHRGR